MKHEPGRLLRDADVLGELRASDPLLVRRDQPDGHHPLTHSNLAVFEDRADLNREALAAITALVGAVVREVIHPCAASERAEGAILPADRGKVIDCGLFVGNGRHHLKQGVELLLLAHAAL